MLLNLRDAGGMPTQDGQRLRTGILYRSDAPIHLDAEGEARLSALGLRTIVDLRRERERERRPYELESFRGRLVQRSLVGEERFPVNPLNGGLASFNRWIYAARGETIAEIVGALASPDAFPALIHCTAGKDRTGLVVGLIQSWLGVPDEVIAADYALSAELLHADTEEAIEKQQIALMVDVRERPDLMEARPEWIVDALEEVRGEHGSVEAYLLTHGATAQDLASVRAALLEP